MEYQNVIRERKLVFLLVFCPELNFIEVIWSLLRRQAINNSTFKDEQEIGQAMVSKRKNIYNKIMTKQSHIFYRGMYPCVYTVVNSIFKCFI